MAQSLADKLAALREAKTGTSNVTPPQESALPAQQVVKKEPEIIAEQQVEDLSSLPLAERLKRLRNNPNAATQTQQKDKPVEKNSLKAMASALRTMPELSPEDHEKAPAEVHSLRSRIWQLQETSDGSNLKNCMQELQVALLENPTAVSFFLPEDYQEMVRYIRKLTGNAVAQSLAKPAGKAKPGAKKPVVTEVSLDDITF